MATPTEVKPELVLSTYGNQIEVISLAKRIKVMVPGGNKLSDAEAQALAQVSLVTKCDPFIGEIWYIPGRGPMIGIKGARRHGNETIEKAGGKDSYWCPEIQSCTPEEAGCTTPKDCAAAYKCTITDSVSTQKFQKMFLETVNALRAAGSQDPVGETREIVGQRPKWIGYGFSTISEQSKMNKQALAMKRAESDALKRKFDIPFGTGVAESDTAAESGEREWIDAKAESVTTMQPAAPTIDDARRLEAVVNKNGAKKQLGNCDASELNYVYLNSIHSENVEAAKMILREDFRMDPPQAEKKTPEQIQAELGFS